MEKQERFKIIELKEGEIRRKKLQTKINFNITKLGKGGRDEWVQEYKKECRQEIIELQELKENLWRWRKQGGGEDNNRKRKNKRTR